MRGKAFLIIVTLLLIHEWGPSTEALAKSEELQIQTTKAMMALDEIRDDISEIKKDVSNIKEDIADIKVEVGVVKTDVDWLKKFFWLLVTATVGAIVTTVHNLIKFSSLRSKKAT